ncbi:helix-hairpin-helix domain-containing protein, partial [Halolamina salifodinae]
MSVDNLDIETHSDVVILVGSVGRVFFDLDDEDMLVRAYSPTERLKENLRTVRRNGGRLFVGVSKMDDVPYFLTKQDVDVFAYKSANEVEYWGSKTRMAANRENGLDPILTIRVDDEEEDERPTLTGGFSEVRERADEVVEDLEYRILAGEEDWREAFDSESAESREEADIDEMLESGPTDERLEELMEAVESEDGEVILVDSGRSGVSKTVEALRAIRAQSDDDEDDQQTEPKYSTGDLILTPSDHDEYDSDFLIEDGYKIVGWYWVEEDGDREYIYQSTWLGNEQVNIRESEIELRDDIEVVEDGGCLRSNYMKNREEDLTTVSGVGLVEEARLRREGYTTMEDLQAATQSDLASVDGIGNALAARVKTDVGDLEDNPGEVPEYIDEIDLTSELQDSIERAANGESASEEEVAEYFSDVYRIEAIDGFEELTPGLQDAVIDIVQKYDLDRDEAEIAVGIALWLMEPIL